MSQITKDINKITGTIIGISGKLIVCTLLILLLVEGITRGYDFGHSIFYQESMEPAPGTEKVLTVAEGESDQDVVANLEDLGLIDNPLAVRIQILFYEYEVHPGTYTLSTAMTPKEILQILDQEPEPEDEEGGTGQ